MRTIMGKRPGLDLDPRLSPRDMKREAPFVPFLQRRSSVYVFAVPDLDDQNRLLGVIDRVDDAI